MLIWLKKHPWLTALFGIIIVLMALEAWLLKPLIKKAIYNATQSYGTHTVNLDALHFNPFLGSIRVKNLELISGAGDDKQVLEAGHTTFKLKILALLESKIHVQSVRFKDALLPLEWREKQLYLAHIPLFKATTESSKADPKESLLPFGIESLELNNIHLSLKHQQRTSTLQIQHLNLANLYSWSKAFSRLKIAALVNQQPVTANLQLHLFKQNPKIVGTFAAESLNLAPFADFFPSSEDSIAPKIGSQLSSQLTFTWQQQANGWQYFQQGEVELNQSTFQHTHTTASLNHVLWQGDLQVNAQSGQLNSKLNGELKAQQGQWSTAAYDDNQSAPLKQYFEALNWTGQTTLNLQNTSQSIALSGALNLSQLQAQTGSSLQHSLQKLAWQGDSSITQLNNTNSQSVQFNGKLNLNALTWQQTPEQAHSLNALSWQGQSKLNLSKKQNNAETTGLLTLNELSVQQPQQQINLQKLSLDGQTQIQQNDSLSVQGEHHIEATNLSLNSLTQEQVATNGIAASVATISGQMHSQLKRTPKATQIKQQGQLQLSDFQGDWQDFNATLNKLSWQGDVQIKQPNINQTMPAMASQTSQKLTTASPDSIQIQSQTNLDLSGFVLQNRKQAQTIAQFSQLELQQLDLESLNKAQLKNLNLKQLLLLDAPAPLTQLNQLTSQGIAYRANHTPQLTVNQVLLNDSQTHIEWNKAQKVTQLERLFTALNLPVSKAETAQDPANKAANVSPAGKTILPKKQTQPAFTYAIKKLQITGQNNIELSLAELAPPFKRSLVVQHLSAEPIQNYAPKTTTEFAIKIDYGDYSQLTSKGHLRLAQPTQQLKANTQLEGLPLKDFSPLAEHFMGYKVLQGQLSADLTTSLNKQQIEAENNVHLSKVKVTSVNAKKAEQINQGFSVPLEAGLKLLQNKKGDINLKLPVNGDISKPSFDIKNIINKALGKALSGATRTYLLMALQPFGAIVLAGEYALDKASTARLQAIEFTPGSVQLSAKMKTYVTKLAALLTENSTLQIQLCGGANQADRSALAQLQATQSNQALQQSKPSEKVKLAPQTQEINDKALLKLAKKRQNVIKRALIEEGIAGKQILLCTPSIDNDDDTPTIKPLI